MERTKAKNLVIRAGLELVSSGLIARTWGNVSCRIDESTFAITPSGRDYQSLTIDDIVEVKINDLSYQGNITPSSEKGIHGAVYQRRPEINFVIHTHQENASAMSSTGLDAFSPGQDFSELGDSIVCAKYALPGTKALCRNVIKALRVSNGNSMILKHHGTLCFGENYEETFQIAHQLEAACGTFINVKGGQIQTEEYREAQPLSEEIKALLMSLKELGQQGHILLNTDSDVVRFASLGMNLKPFLDDFAQIVGIKIRSVQNKPEFILEALKSASAVLIKDIGAICWGRNEKDAAAVSMIVRKNCKAYFAASAFGRPKPIHSLECALMRQIYLKNYSRLSEKNKSGGQQ